MADTATLPGSGRKLFFGLFIFPLVIAVGMALLLCSIVLMTHEQETPENLIASLKKSSPGKRWQKAFELSNEINRNPGQAQSPAVLREMIEVLRDGQRFDAKTRGYMALALSGQSAPQALGALTEALADPEEEVVVYALWALGRRADATSAVSVAALTTHDSAQVRKVAAYALGSLNAKEFRKELTSLLEDPVTDVRWNAALSLARLRDGAGRPVLQSMLQRPTLSGVPAMSEEQVEAAMVNAAKGLALIPDAESIKILETVSRQDKNMRVRQAALDALRSQEKK